MEVMNNRMGRGGVQVCFNMTESLVAHAVLWQYSSTAIELFLVSPQGLRIGCQTPSDFGPNSASRYAAALQCACAHGWLMMWALQVLQVHARVRTNALVLMVMAMPPRLL